MIELAYQNELRVIALRLLYDFEGQDEVGIERATKYILEIRPDTLIEDARNAARKAFEMDRLERQIGFIFKKEIENHSYIIYEEYKKLQDISKKVIDFDFRNEGWDEGVNLRDQVWEKIFNIISHAGSIYNIFSPHTDTKTRDLSRNRRIHRQTIVRNYAGINEDLLRPFKDIRNAQTHFDEYMDDYIWEIISAGKLIQDKALLGSKNLLPPAQETVIIRSYDLKEDRVYYKAKEKTIRIGAVIEFISAINQCYQHNFNLPVPYLTRPMYFEMKPEWSIH